jgi:hypothetical protein
MFIPMEYYYFCTENEVYGVICHCGRTDVLQYTDYVVKPMIWCDSCGARVVLDIPLEREQITLGTEVDRPTIKNFSLSSYGSDIRTEDFYSPKTKFYKANAFKIKRVMNCALEQYRAPRLLTREEVCNLIPLVDVRDGPTQVMLGDLCIVERNDYELNDKFQEFGLTEEDFWISVECDSYDVESPRIPYPEKFHTDHDGINVWLELEGPRGIEYCVYWGD